MLTVDVVDSQSMEIGPVYTQESAPEQERSYKFPINGPDLGSESLSLEANKTWRATLLSLSIVRIVALWHTDLQEGNDSARPVT